MKKFCRKLHLWLAVPVGLIFCVMCLTGAILVFEAEITDAYYSDARKVTPAGEPLSDVALEQALTPQLPEGAEIKDIQRSDNPAVAWTVSLSKPPKSKLYVNPYDGKVTGKRERLGFFNNVMKLHRWLLDAPKKKGEMSVGKWITGISTILFVFILLSGLVLWWPRNSKGLKVALSLKGRNSYGQWRALHSAGGFYCLLILLICVLTGLTWSFGWYGKFAHEILDINYFDWHAGHWGGLVTKILWCAAALYGASLPITGYWLWLKRLSLNAKKNA